QRQAHERLVRRRPDRDGQGAGVTGVAVHAHDVLHQARAPRHLGVALAPDVHHPPALAATPVTARAWVLAVGAADGHSTQEAHHEPPRAPPGASYSRVVAYRVAGLR